MVIAEEAAAHFGREISDIVSSAYRSFDTQESLRRDSPGCAIYASHLQCVQKDGNPVGALDSSYHPSGLAIDFNIGHIPGLLDWLNRSMIDGESYVESHGLKWFTKYNPDNVADNVHFSPSGS